MEKVQCNSINKKQKGLKQSKNDESSTLPHTRSGEEMWNEVQRAEKNTARTLV